MDRSRLTRIASLAVVAALALTGCSSGDSGDESGPVTLTVGGWSLATTPEFELLAEGFQKSHPDVKVEVKEYDAANYDTQMTADLSAGSAPDVYPIKCLCTFATYQGGGQLLDVSDVTGGLDETVKSAAAPYTVDGATYAVPYREDGWFLYYDRDMFEAAKVDEPDGSWTWDDYAAAAGELAKAPGADAGTYTHTWASAVQGFANAQTADGQADFLAGDFAYLQPYYERALELQKSKAAVDYGTATTNTLTYQGEFGTQKVPMMLMGSWYIATLLAQQESGDAETFDWGFAPAPQIDASTLSSPVTFGGPTGMGINAGISDRKVDAAKEFLAYISGDEGSTALAEIGITPANTSDAVAEAFFAVEGMPDDELAKSTFSTRVIRPEVPVSANTPTITTLLNDAHTAIMSGSSDVPAALEAAKQEYANQIGG
ncbi:extracellular solute-binding protein [Kineosporia succinea]|uniref:Multiple sugar transport system substrate-binding protein n=1 Tax=Kineosporia succinea TaxID=84632 RepID=A0ABT9P8W3_9ACTN|nr:extracellular solute-binding protein [Kineosporia succinea]MDP9828854.1 multiple sugar transport system substrate-binding protein [Kineosporia succinea]